MLLSVSEGQRHVSIMISLEEMTLVMDQEEQTLQE